VEWNSFGIRIYDKHLTLGIAILFLGNENDYFKVISFYIFLFSIKTIIFPNGIVIPHTKGNLSLSQPLIPFT
jgi:hypothetical protein